jgi:protein TonB
MQQILVGLDEFMPRSAKPGTLTRRLVLASVTAGGHLAAASFLVLAGPGLRDAALDSTAMIVDMVTHSPVSEPEPPRPRPTPQVVVRKEPPLVLAVARNQPLNDSSERVPVQETLKSSPPPAAAPASTAATAGDPTPALVPARFDADYLNNPKPPYPAFSRRLGEQGKVLLSVSVSTQGQPENIEIKLSSGSPRLDQAALDAVKRWRFVPAKRGDTPIQSWVTVPIVFSLEG